MSYTDKIINENVTLKKNTIWYTAGSLTSSLSSVLLMLFVTRTLGDYDAGIFSMAWAIAQLMLTVGWYNTRHFQVSDIKQEYTFNDYVSLKTITSIIAVLGGIVYSVAIGNYGYDLWTTISLCLFILSDVFGDVFAGYFQQVERLYIAGKSNVYRISLRLLTFLILLMLTQNLILSILVATIVALLFLCVFDYQIYKKISKEKVKISYKKTVKLVIECTPLFIASFLTNFLVNIPKNSINEFCSKEMQAFYNILFMPSSVISMFTMFIFVPLFTSISRSWHDCDYKKFKRIILKILFLLTVLTLVILAGAYLLGIPVLNIVYNVKLDEYKLSLLVLLLGGSLTALSNVLNFLITILRKQKTIIYGYGISVVVCWLISDYFVINFGLFGASLVYLIAMLSVSLYLGLVSFICITKQMKSN